MDPTFLVLATLLAIVASAFFAGTETAILTANRLTIRHRARQGSGPDAMLVSILESPSLPIAACVLGNALFHTIAAACTDVAVAPVAPELGSVISALILTPVFLILAEIVPKESARRRGTDLLPVLLLPLRVWIAAVLPVLLIARRLVERLLVAEHGAGPRVTREDLRHMLWSGVAAGVIHPRHERMLSGALGLSRTTVREVMVPLTMVRALKEDDRVGTLLALARATKLTRFPVYRDRVDQVQGIVNVYDVLFSDHEPDAPIRHHMRPCLCVPNTLPVDKILRTMQARKEPMAIVVDEFGGTDGVVTIKDIVEEVVGELEARPAGASPGIRRLGPLTYEVDSSRDIDRVNEDLGLEIPKKGYETLGGFLMTALEKVPAVGDRVSTPGASFEVTQVRGRAAHRVLIVLQRPLSATAGRPPA